VQGHGLCSTHYMRWRKHGSPHKLLRTPNNESSDYLAEVVMKSDTDRCIVWPYLRNNKGYAVIGKGGGMKLVTRIVCEQTHGAPKKNWHAAHICGKGHTGCVNPRHLRWATPSENHFDKRHHGTDNRGIRNPNAILSDRQVLQIRSLKGTMSQNRIAEKFGVTDRTINDIMSFRTWRHLPQ
jgi:hypothetical protein